MHRNRPTVLITGFGPFPGQPNNASSRLAEALAAEAPRCLPGYAVRAVTLPTEWESGPRMLGELLAEMRPAVALHFGVSSKASGFVIESRARNARSTTLDACGAIPPNCEVDPDGPEAHTSTLPVRLILERLRRRRFPVQLSRDAGTYLCNAVLYHSLADARRWGPGGSGPGVRRGFVHIPDRLLGEPGATGRRAVPSLLDWESAVAGGLEIVSVSVRVASSVARSRTGPRIHR